MDIKKHLKIALIGTGRSQLSGELLSELKEWELQSEDPTDSLLNLAAAYALSKKAAYQPQELDFEISENKNPESKAVCPPNIEKLLLQILKGIHRNALGEFLNLLAPSNYRLPPLLIPELLEIAVKEKRLQDPIFEAAGGIGQWIIQQHPDWQLPQHPENDLDVWDYGKTPERKLFLENLRLQDPKQGLNLLQEEWEKESLAVKIVFLKTLKLGLSKDDETFLENCLKKEKSKELKRVAIELLSSIPQGLFAERLQKTLLTIVLIDKHKLSIHFPEKMPSFLSASGKTKLKGGQKANDLLELIRLQDPDIWLSQAELPIEATIELFNKNEWSTALLEGLAQAALLFENTAWIEHLFLNSLEEKWLPLKSTSTQLLEAIKQNPLPRTISQFLANQKQPFAKSHAYIQLLLSESLIWNEHLGRAFAKHFKMVVNYPSLNYWTFNHYPKILKEKAAYKVKPKQKDEFQREWSYEMPIRNYFSEDIEFFFETMLFRTKMYRVLQTDSNTN